MGKTTIIAQKGTQNIVISRVFKAPRELVYRTFTNPATMSDWWGPSNLEMVVDVMDVKRGGSWRYIHRDSEGNEYVHNGVYHECVEPERLVNTYEFEGAPGYGLVTVTFEELPEGATKLTETTIYPSEQTRDAVIESGMSEGVIELMDRLEQLLYKLQGHA